MSILEFVDVLKKIYGTASHLTRIGPRDGAIKCRENRCNPVGGQKEGREIPFHGRIGFTLRAEAGQGGKVHSATSRGSDRRLGFFPELFALAVEGEGDGVVPVFGGFAVQKHCGGSGPLWARGVPSGADWFPRAVAGGSVGAGGRSVGEEFGGVERKLSQVRAEMGSAGTEFGESDRKLDQVGSGLDQVDERLGEVWERLGQVEEPLDQVEDDLTKFADELAKFGKDLNKLTNMLTKFAGDWTESPGDLPQFADDWNEFSVDWPRSGDFPVEWATEWVEKASGRPHKRTKRYGEWDGQFVSARPSGHAA